jgi:hypothetical protein
VISIGVTGFMVCESFDFTSRMNLLEAIVLNDFDSLSSGYFNRPMRQTDSL